MPGKAFIGVSRADVIEIRTQHDITQYLILRHLNMADSDAQAENLFQLELDGRTDLRKFGVQILSM